MGPYTVYDPAQFTWYLMPEYRFPEPLFIDYDETTHTFHLEMEQGPLDIPKYYACTPEDPRGGAAPDYHSLTIVYADHNCFRCFDINDNGYDDAIQVVHWEIKVEVLP